MIGLRMDRRVLGAVAFVDATTGAPIRRALQVVTVAKVFRQRSGLLVIADAPGLHEHTLAFERPPATPATGSVPVRLQVTDPGREYQSTTVDIPLPRNPAPDADADDSILRPYPVKLWRTGAAPVSPNWTVLQATVLQAGSSAPVVGALVTLQAAGQVLQALTDATGQVTLALVGQPLFTLAGNGTLSRTLDAQISVRTAPNPDDALLDVEAEIARLSALQAAATFTRTLPTGAATQDILPVGP